MFVLKSHLYPLNKGVHRSSLSPSRFARASPLAFDGRAAEVPQLVYKQRWVELWSLVSSLGEEVAGVRHELHGLRHHRRLTHRYNTIETGTASRCQRGLLAVTPGAAAILSLMCICTWMGP